MFYLAVEAFKTAIGIRPTSLINDILIESLIYQTFYHLDSEYPIRKKRPKNNSHFKLKLAINYLNDNYSDHNCSVSSLCNKIDISRSHLYNIFKAEFNISPQKYLIKIRMEKAKNRLKNTPSSIQEISVSVGYIDEFTFLKRLRSILALVPKHIDKWLELILILRSKNIQKNISAKNSSKQRCFYY